MIRAHGIASAGENYLLPVDIGAPSSAELRLRGLRQSEILEILTGEAPNAAHYLVLDACRNTLRGSRGGKGFVAASRHAGVLIAYAAEPGKTASDLGVGGGPYAKALAAELVRPGQSDLLMFHQVRVRVIDNTGNDQVPWTEDGIQRRNRFAFADAAQPGGADRGDGARAGAVRPQIAPEPQPEPPKVVIRRGKPVGGATGGNAFDDADSNESLAAVTRLEVGVNRSIANGSELIIGGVQAVFGDVAGPRHGFGGPNPVTTQPLILAPGEVIRSLTMFARRYTWGVPQDAPVWVSGLQIRTSRRSVSFGDRVGTKIVCEISAGERLVGFHGRAGSYVDQLGCLVAGDAAPPPLKR
ncbi:MAG: jacalin-like lectin [Hyphomicrobiaceae bacterium]